MKKLFFKVCRVFGAAFYELGREDFHTPCPWDDKEEEEEDTFFADVSTSTSNDGGRSWHAVGPGRDWQGGRFGSPTVSFREAHGHDCPTCGGRGMAHMGNPPCGTCGT